MVTTSRWRHVGRLAIGTRSQDESPPSSAAVLGGDKHYLRAQESLRTMHGPDWFLFALKTAFTSVMCPSTHRGTGRRDPQALRRA